MWRLVLALVVASACKGDAPPSQPPQPAPAHTFRIPIVSATPPALVAVRADDGGGWQALAIRDDGYDVPTSPRFTLVVVCAHWLGSYVELRHWTAEDDRSFAVACVGFDGEPLADVTPAFAKGGDMQRLATGGIHETCSSNVPTCRLRTGMHDAAVIHGENDATRARILRDVSIFDGARIDADASRGFTPDRRTLEVVSAFRGNNNSVYVCLETRRGEGLLCSGQTYWRTFPERVVQPYIRVPDAARVETDCDVLEVQQTRMCIRDAPTTRVDIAAREVAPMRYDRTARTLAFSLGDADALNVVVHGTDQKAPRWNVIATRRWLGTASQYTLPDVAAIPGWRAAWSVGAGERIDGNLIWGPKPSSNQPRPRLWQRLRPGDRMDTAGGRVEEIR